MFKKIFSLLVFIISFQVISATQKEVISEYMTNDKYKILFDEEHFNKELSIFKNKTFTDEAMFNVINGEKYSLITELFFSMLNDPRVPLLAPITPKRIYNQELAYIDTLYTSKQKAELLTEMDCTAASVIDDFSCGIAFWNKMSAGTLVDLTFNTVLMAPLVAVDLITAGSGSAVRNTVKVASKSARPILTIRPVAQKIIINSSLISPSATLKVLSKLEKIRINPSQFAAMENLLNSKAFSLMKKIVKSIAVVSGDLAKLDQNQGKEILGWLDDLNTEIPEFKQDCTQSFSDDACKYFDSFRENEISDAKKAALNLGLAEISLIISQLDSKLTAIIFEFINIGIIDPLTDNEDSEFLDVLFDLGIFSAEFIPVAGPVIAWINSVNKAKQQMGQNASDAINKYRLFVAAKNAKYNGAMIRYQIAVIEDSIYRINNSVNQILFQILSPEILWPNPINLLNTRAAFNNDIYQLNHYRQLMTKNSELKSSCSELTTGISEITINKITFDIFIDRCKSITYKKKDMANYKVSYNLISNTVKHLPLNTFNDVRPNNEYSSAINYLLQLGVVDNRNTNFYPDKSITRGEFYAMFVRAFYPSSKEQSFIVWSQRYLNVLQKNQPWNTFNTELDIEISAIEVAKIATFGHSIESSLGTFAENAYGDVCNHLNSNLFKLLSHSYLITSRNNLNSVCPYNILDNSDVSRGQAARLIVNLIQGVQ